MSPDPAGPRFRHDTRGTSAEHWRERPEWTDVPVLELSGPRRPTNVVVCAAHPDDETLGAGGLIRSLHLAGTPVRLALASAGERSHPRSPTTSPADLAARRLVEVDRAWGVLGGTSAGIDFWGLPDGGLSSRVEEMVQRLVSLVDDGPGTLLVATWRYDGHPDHDALGRAARIAAHRSGARLLEYPVWFWHHATGDRAPWSQMTRIPLDGDASTAKAVALACHATQVAPLSPSAGDETLLTPDFLEHFASDFEAYIDQPPTSAPGSD